MPIASSEVEVWTDWNLHWVWAVQ